MTDLNKENTLPQDPTAQPTGQPALSAEKTQEMQSVNDIAPTSPEPAQPITRGEKWYDWIVYSGINYWLNLGISLIIADAVTHGRGKQSLEKTAKFIGKNDKHTHNAKVGLEQLALNSGGWLLLVPMKLMEDRKRPLVHWLNKKLGVEQKGADGHELSPDEIHIEKKQPRQSWARVVGRRILASAATIIPGIVLDNSFRGTRKEPIMVDGKTIDTIGGKERFTNFIVNKSNQALNSGFIPGGRELAKKEWAQRYLSLAALDVINTKITATVMHLTNGARKVEDEDAKHFERDAHLLAKKHHAGSAAKEIISRGPQTTSSYVQRLNTEPTPAGAPEL